MGLAAILAAVVARFGEVGSGMVAIKKAAPEDRPAYDLNF
jgi:hypothetical protein